MKTAVVTILVLAALCVVIELIPTRPQPAEVTNGRTRVIPLQELRQANWRPESRLRELFRKLNHSTRLVRITVKQQQPETPSAQN